MKKYIVFSLFILLLVSPSYATILFQSNFDTTHDNWDCTAQDVPPGWSTVTEGYFNTADGVTHCSSEITTGGPTGS